MRIELLNTNQKPRLLYTGKLNPRGTTEAQFHFPANLVGSYQLRYVVDTTIGLNRIYAAREVRGQSFHSSHH